jgi:hypothetical protein
MTESTSSHSEGPVVTVSLSRDELLMAIGGITEAIYALGDDEFAIRIGPTADEARDFVRRLVAARKSLGPRQD